MAAIPIRLPPLPGEALDSWLETYACLLHVTVRHIFALAGLDWGRFTSEGDRQHKLGPARPRRAQRHHRGSRHDPGRHDAGPV